MMVFDYDWEDMREVRRTAAMFVLTLYIGIIVIILLNMLLAIIMDAYTIVKRNMRHAVTLSRQVQEMWRRWRMTRRKERVRLNDIWDALLATHKGDEKEMLDSKRDLSVSIVKELIPGIPLEQAL